MGQLLQGNLFYLNIAKQLNDTTMTLTEIKETVFNSTAEASKSLVESGLKFYGKTPDKRGKRNYNIFTDESSGIDYHVSYDIVTDGFKVSMNDVTDRL